MSRDKRTLTPVPWRNFINWDESVGDCLQQLIEIFAKPGDFVADSDKPFFNILLTGMVGSGKSALYHMYKLRSGSKPDPLPWRIGDTPGIIPSEGENQIKNILQIVDGHVPEGYEFGVGEKFDSHSERFIAAPSPSCKIDCVAIVINASRLFEMPEKMKSLLQSLKRGLTERGIPTFAMLTKVDVLQQDVQNDVKNVYRSTEVRGLVSRTSEMLLDLPVHKVLPVVNYRDQIETNHDIDVLLMQSFSQLIEAKQQKRKNMKSKITELVPVTKSGKTLPFFNVLLVGQTGSGKSSFFNGINAILTNRMFATKAEAGFMATSLTKEFRMYEIAAPVKGKVLSTRIGDTFGLKEKADDDTDVRNVLSVIYGHVPDKYTFTEKEFHQECPGYIASPALENKTHCVCIAIDAGKVGIMYDNVWRKLRSVYTALENRGIPAKVLLMKIDTVLDDNESIQNIHQNKKVRHVKRIVQKKLRCGIRKKDMFPIKNYVTEIEFDVDMDMLLLDSLLHMLECAQNYLTGK